MIWVNRAPAQPIVESLPDLSVILARQTMRVIWGATFAATTMGLAVWLGATSSASGPSVAEPIAAPGPAGTPAATSATAVANASAAGNYLGVASCASAACHGGPISADPSQKWRSSYTVWATLDKHSRAYSVLFEHRSRQIVKLLDHLADADQAKPYEDQRCLACHSIGSTAHSTSNVVADGVGCELCHGPAQNWVTLHTERAWLDSRSAANFGRLPGMTDTRNLVIRATTCAGCHVGSPAENGHPARDVNHDLIAAGHPRLNFEFHAYLGVMPKHWTDTPGAKPNYKTDSDTHAQAWAIGQAVSADAALRLKAARAAQQSTDAAGKTVLATHGIEFSEFDCYACHHELSVSFPSKRQAAAEANSTDRQAGTLSVNAWYFVSPELLMKSQFFGAQSAQSAERLKPFVDGRWSPAEKTTTSSQDAAAVSAAIHQLAELANSITWDSARVNDLLNRAAESSTITPTWDAAAQRFLAIEALLAARRRLRAETGAAADPNDPEIDRATARVRDSLAFPTLTSRDATGQSAIDGRSRVDSPQGFDPAKTHEAFDRLFALLHQSLRVEGAK